MTVTAHIFTDAEGIIRFWSPEAEALFGYTMADTLGQSIEMLIVPQYRVMHRGGFAAAMAARVDLREDTVANIPIICADGKVRAFPGRLIVTTDVFRVASGVLAVFIAPAEDGAPNGLYDLFPEVLS
jgi:PAS domain S-box-containing protein